MILTNGARFYVDHAHPEYSAPECTNPRDVAGLGQARASGSWPRRAGGPRWCPNTPPINLYKNNTDNKGASYGTHENYLMRRETPFADIVTPPHAVLRQPPGRRRAPAGSASARTAAARASRSRQRADYFEVEVGLETTLKRPIINTRDEPHAVAEKYRRLHVIIGDANLAEVSTYLKVGTTALVLAMIEDQFLSVDLTVDRAGGDPARGVARPDPAAAGDAAGRAQADRGAAADGVRRAGPQVRRGPVRRRRRPGDDRRAGPLGVGARPARDRPDVARRASSTGSPSCRSWRATASRDGLDWGRPRLEAVDLQYSDVRPDKGLYNRLAASGRFERIVTEAEVEPGR